MPRPTSFVDDDDESPAVKAVKNGEPLSEHGDDLSKTELKQVSRELDYEEFEERLLEEAARELQDWGLDVKAGEVELNVVDSRDDISHIDRELEIDNNGAYIPWEDEILLFASDSGTSMGTSRSYAYTTTMHEFKHHHQDKIYDKDNLTVKESSARLINMYREGKLDSESLRKEEVRKIRSGDYTHAEDTADELEIATSVYSNLREAGKSRDEAMEFLLNEYEEKRWDLV